MFARSILMSGIITIVSFSLLMADEETAGKLASQIQADQATRQEKVSKIENWLNYHPEAEDAFVLEYLLLELYQGNYCEESMNVEKMQKQLERMVVKYEKREAKNIYLLKAMITYAQLIADSDPEKSKQLFRRVLEMPLDDIEVPSEYKWAYLGKEASVNRLKQGVIWAILNERTRSVQSEPDEQKKNLAYKKAYKELTDEMSETEEGERCLPLAKWWYDVAISEKLSDVDAPNLNLLHPRTEPEEVSAREILEKRRLRREKQATPLADSSVDNTEKVNAHAVTIIRPADDVDIQVGSSNVESEPGSQYVYWIAGGLACVGVLLVFVGGVFKRQSS